MLTVSVQSLDIPTGSKQTART